ncbi:MAG: hypothetical protein ACYCVZ_09165 [Streptosporangiaceae bacterium]
MLNLKPGDRVPMQIMGSATSSANGSYEIRLTSPLPLPASASSGGVVNLEVVASKGTAETGMFSFSRRLVQTRRGAELVPLYGNYHQPATVARQTGPIRLMRSAHPQNVKAPCQGMQLVAIYKKRLGIVGASYSRYAGENTQWFTYGNGQSSSIGVGVSASGTYGSFTASGTYSEFGETGLGVSLGRGPVDWQGTTGWSNEAAITYKMGTYSHDICGTANYPGSTPKKIVIGLP